MSHFLGDHGAENTEAMDCVNRLRTNKKDAGKERILRKKARKEARRAAKRE